MVHGITGMSPGLIATEQVEMLVPKAGRHDFRLYIMIVPVTPLLGPTRGVLPDRNAYRNTGIAGMAMWFIHNIATTAITGLQENCKLRVIEWIVRFKHEGGCGFLRQIGTTVWS